MEEAGFLIFAAKENQVLEGGRGGATNFPVFHIYIAKKTNDSIICI